MVPIMLRSVCCYKYLNKFEPVYENLPVCKTCSCCCLEFSLPSNFSKKNSSKSNYPAK